MMENFQLLVLALICWRCIIRTSRDILTVEVRIMTSKELQYLEDALGHEKFFQTKCNEAMNELTDENLRGCIQTMAQKHQQIFSGLYGLL